MLRIRDIMSTEIVTLSPGLSVRDAMDVLTRHHITGAPVLTNGKVVGVVSLTDLAEWASQAPGIPTQRPPVEDPDDWENVADQAYLEEPPAAYFVEMWDDAGADVTARISQTDAPEWNALEDHTVGEIMNRRILALPADAPVDHAAAVMRRAHVHRVLVMEDARLVGVATTTDIANAVADHRMTSRVYVFGGRAEARGG
jgi:CBS domain-containing protein